MARPKAAVIIGAGEYLGAALTRRFASEGHIACPVRRNIEKLSSLCSEIGENGGEAIPFGADVRNEKEVIDLLADIEQEVGDIDVVIFNVGANIRYPIMETPAIKFQKVWEMGCFAGFLVGREAAKLFAAKGRGSILFTGATSSVRGIANFSAFSSAKQGLKAIAQSMARELGPLGIHVAHVIIDGPIDTEFVRTLFPDWIEERGEDGLMDPDQLSDIYWWLYQQPKKAWTFEIDVRTFKEPW